MNKTIRNRLFVIASIGLLLASGIFLCISILDDTKTSTPLAISLACILLANLCNIIRLRQTDSTSEQDTSQCE